MGIKLKKIFTLSAWHSVRSCRDMQRLFFCLLFVAIPWGVQAQGLRLADSVYTDQVVNGYAYHYSDLHEKLEATDLIGHQPKIDFNTQNSLNFGFYTGAIWLKIDLENRSEEEDWYVEIAHPPLDSIDFYLIQNNQIIAHQVAGDDFPFGQRPVAHRNFLFPISIKANEHYTCLIKVRADKSTLRIPLRILPQHKLATTDSPYQLVMGIYFGFLIAAAIYGLITFWMLGYRANLYYGLYILFGLLFFSTQTGHFYQYLIPNQSELFNRLPAVTVSLLLVFTTLFVMDILSLKQVSLFWYWVHLAIVFILVFCALYQFIDYRSSNILSVYMAPLVFAIFLVSSIAVWQKGVSIAVYLIPSWAFYTFGVFINALRNFGVVPNSFINDYGFYVAAIVEIFMLTIALSINQRKLLLESERSKQRARMKELELENERMRAQQLILQKDAIHRQLVSASIEKQQQEELLAALEKVDSDEGLRQKINKLLVSRHTQSNGWDHFKTVFEEVHPDFFKRVQQEYPALGINDLRQLAFIKMNLKAKEIALLTGVSLDAVKKARTRLKQKIATDDLAAFVNTF